MHAKMTRDRKKGFIAAIQKNIQDLEMQNKRMREVLTKVAQEHTMTKTVTPIQSPVLRPTPTKSEKGSSSQIPDIIQEEMGIPELLSILPRPT